MRYQLSIELNLKWNNCRCIRFAVCISVYGYRRINHIHDWEFFALLQNATHFRFVQMSICDFVNHRLLYCATRTECSSNKMWHCVCVLAVGSFSQSIHFRRKMNSECFPVRPRLLLLHNIYKEFLCFHQPGKQSISANGNKQQNKCLSPSPFYRFRLG